MAAPNAVAVSSVLCLASLAQIFQATFFGCQICRAAWLFALPSSLGSVEVDAGGHDCGILDIFGVSNVLLNFFNEMDCHWELPSGLWLHERCMANHRLGVWSALSKVGYRLDEGYMEMPSGRARYFEGRTFLRCSWSFL